MIGDLVHGSHSGSCFSCSNRESVSVHFWKRRPPRGVACPRDLVEFQLTSSLEVTGRRLRYTLGVLLVDEIVSGHWLEDVGVWGFSWVHHVCGHLPAFRGRDLDLLPCRGVDDEVSRGENLDGPNRLDVRVVVVDVDFARHLFLHDLDGVFLDVFAGHGGLPDGLDVCVVA